MKLVEPNVELVKCDNTLDGIKKKIELLNKKYYDTYYNIDANSYYGLFNDLLYNDPNKLLHHATVYLTIDLGKDNKDYTGKLLKDRDSRVVIHENAAYITTSIYVLNKLMCLDALDFISDCTPIHKIRCTIDIRTSKHSAGYFLLLGENFKTNVKPIKMIKGEFEFINPISFDYSKETLDIIIDSYKKSEEFFERLLNENILVDEARNVLSGGVKVDLLISTYEDDFQNIYDECFINKSIDFLFIHQATICFCLIKDEGQ